MSLLFRRLAAIGPLRSAPSAALSATTLSATTRRFVVTEVSSREFLDDKIKGAGAEKLVVVQYSAAWCAPCRGIRPQVKELSDNAEKVEFYLVDIDEHTSLTEDSNVEKVPTFVFLRNGKEVHRVEGAKVSLLKEGLAAHVPT
eukprot:Selendium_serpulae@DN3624_c0_g1_i2.p2